MLVGASSWRKTKRWQRVKTRVTTVVHRFSCAVPAPGEPVIQRLDGRLVRGLGPSPHCEDDHGESAHDRKHWERVDQDVEA